MIEYATTFLATFSLDLVYTYYLKCVERDHILGASLWSVACYVLGGVAIINFTSNYWLLVPACVGAFCGTFVGMVLKKRSRLDK